MNSEQDIERQIKELELNAPRLTPDMISSLIASTVYHVFEGTCLTVCVLTLRNGFTVTGESACASPENFNKEIGERIAYSNAREKIWALAGYALKERLYRKQESENRHWAVKLKVEYLQLSNRIYKLNTFITDNPIYEKMSYDEKQLYVDQLDSMIVYRDTLKKRLDNHEKTLINS